MYNSYSQRVEYTAYVQRLAQEHRAGEALQKQMMRQSRQLLNSIVNLLSNIGRLLPLGTPNTQIQLDPS